MPTDPDQPAFIIRAPDGRAIEIYANGEVKGLEHAPGLTMVVNRIPALEALAWEAGAKAEPIKPMPAPSNGGLEAIQVIERAHDEIRRVTSGRL